MQVIDAAGLRQADTGRAPRPLDGRTDRGERLPPSRRSRLYHSRVALVENLQSSGAGQGFSPEFQVCLPYAGLFVWHVGGQPVVADANQILFVTRGEPFHVSGRLDVGYGEIIITPPADVLAELAGASEARLAAHPLFRRRSRRADVSVQALRARLLHSSRQGERDGLVTDALVLELLRSALDAPGPPCELRATTRRLIRRTKEFVEGHLSTPLRLCDVAAAVHASPAYLTHVFRRAEGVPLHRYVVQLRLARALIELPHVTDLTSLALDLGFSSHSHFTAAFRRAFGCTPSEFRESTRGMQKTRIA